MTARFHRGRRLRRNPTLRRMVRETELRPQDMVQPYFVIEDDDLTTRRPISSMPGQEQLGLQALEERVAEYMPMGLHAAILFGLPREKDPQGSQAYAAEGIVQQAIRRLKDRFPDLVIIADTCLCEYTSHGHCGLVENNDVNNDATLELLAQTAVSQAAAGADIVAPSDMMDGRVLAIRDALDQAGFSHIPVLSYAVKYASAFYGPFREAADSTPQFGDRKTYQMDPGNSREGLLEAAADISEGADMLMVKPAMPYLDVLRDLRVNFELPLAAYQVSGEFAMIKAAAEKGWLDEERTMTESLTAIKRAGADMIISYFGEAMLRLWDEG